MSNKSFFKNLQKGLQKKLGVLFPNPYKEANVTWAKLKYFKNLKSGKIRTHHLFNKTLYYYSPPELLHGLKEIFTDKIYKQELQNKPYIIDCGANIGLSIIYMKEHFPEAEIIAFEPDETNFDLLKKNMNSFGYLGVSIYKEAVWNENTTLLFSNISSMGSKIDLHKNEYSIVVKAIRLKDFLNRQVDFLKIDIEGAENIVLTDIEDNLHYVKNMFLEYHGSFDQNKELLKMINIVSNAGFNFYIKEATSCYDSPFYRKIPSNAAFDIQLNIFCFRNK